MKWNSFFFGDIAFPLASVVALKYLEKRKWKILKLKKKKIAKNNLETQELQSVDKNDPITEKMAKPATCCEQRAAVTTASIGGAGSANRRHRETFAISSGFCRHSEATSSCRLQFSSGARPPAHIYKHSQQIIHNGTMVRGEGCAPVVRGRSRMSIDPRIPSYNTGTEPVGFSPIRQTYACTKQSEAPCGLGLSLIHI